MYTTILKELNKKIYNINITDYFKNTTTDKEKIFIKYTIESDQLHPTTIKLVEDNKVQILNFLTIYNKYKDINNFVDQTKKNFYTTFNIPKHSGGYRTITAPNESLKLLQRKCLSLLQDNLKILESNSAYAYSRKRDNVANAERHKSSKYVIALDLENFFPSISAEILENALNKISVLNVNIPCIEDLKRAIIDLAILDNELPQGTPLSPFLSNIVMLDFDFKLKRAMENRSIPNYIYTRYADDICLSAKKLCDVYGTIDKIQLLLNNCYNEKFQLKKEKTKILKNTNKLYITGVKLNKDNKITYGHENKKRMKNEIYNLFIKEKNNELTKEQVQETLGTWSYMYRIEKGYALYIQTKYLKFFNSKEKTLIGHFKYLYK
ncbi:MAG: reverse transcriptase domain-containing protein [Bacilli bacterium]